MRVAKEPGIVEIETSDTTVVRGMARNGYRYRDGPPEAIRHNDHRTSCPTKNARVLSNNCRSRTAHCA